MEMILPKLTSSPQLELQRHMRLQMFADSESEIGKILSPSDLLQSVRDLEQELDQLSCPPELNLKVARSLGLRIQNEWDLCVIKGIGPQTAKMLKSSGIKTLFDLAKKSDSQIRRLFELGEPQLRHIRPRHWQEQARLAVENKWQNLLQLQSNLGHAA